MYIAYISMFSIAVLLSFIATHTGTTTTNLEKRAEATFGQMHYYHTAAFREFEDCMNSGTCTAGPVDVSPHLDDTMTSAPAFDTGRFLSFIDPTADVSDSPMDGILVTIWVEGGDEEPIFSGRAYTEAHLKEHSYYITGRAQHVSGNNYEIKLPEATSMRTPLRLDEATFNIGGLGLSQRNHYLTYYSAGTNIY